MIKTPMSTEETAPRKKNARETNPNRRPYSQHFTEIADICDFYMGEAERRSITTPHSSHTRKDENRICCMDCVIDVEENYRDKSTTGSSASSILEKRPSRTFSTLIPNKHRDYSSIHLEKGAIVPKKRSFWRWIILGIFIILALSAFLSLFFLWPRNLVLGVSKIDAQKTNNTDGKPFNITSSPAQVSFNMTNDISILITNPNYVASRVEKLAVQAKWVLKDGTKLLFGKLKPSGNQFSKKPISASTQSQVNKSVTIKQRSHIDINLIWNIEHKGNPHEDPIFRDYLKRCEKIASLKNDAVVIDFEIKTIGKILGKTNEQTKIVRKKFGCQLATDQIKAIFTQVENHGNSNKHKQGVTDNNHFNEASPTAGELPAPRPSLVSPSPSPVTVTSNSGSQPDGITGEIARILQGQRNSG